MAANLTQNTIMHTNVSNADVSSPTYISPGVIVKGNTLK